MHAFPDVIPIARKPLESYLHKFFFSRARILCVVDAEISTDLADYAFGIGRVIQLMRDSVIGCMSFDVDIARRPYFGSTAFSVVAAPGATEPKYLGFRFDSTLPDGTQVIDHYDEIWCFGFRPGNNAGPDANIDSDPHRATPQELAALTTWMRDKKGGMFATGDHDYLGASMCRSIPRVGTMRAWTNAQGVPPIDGLQRIDTNRPYTPSQQSGADVIPFDVQQDVLPQPIEWVPWISINVPFFRVRQRPHPVLCHPTLGPINVMPDHPHEGTVFDHTSNPDTGLAAITLTNTVAFDGTNFGPEYPTQAGVQPLPQVIAFGNTLADPPLQQEKGDSPAKHFAMISVYDGHRVEIGRVAVDSTWHHWMNINIHDMEVAGGDNWEKIKRYFQNLGVWLAPPNIPRHCCFLHVLEAFYTPLGVEELNHKTDILDAGIIVRDRLLKFYGPCWVTHWIFDWLGAVNANLRERLFETYTRPPRPPFPNPCLTCPPLELIETAVLGGMTLAAAEAIGHRGDVSETLGRLSDLRPDALEKQMLRGATAGIREVNRRHAASLKQAKDLMDTFEGEKEEPKRKKEALVN